MKKDLAIVTMVYDDIDYLRIWLEYWRKNVAGDQLYVLVHGGNDTLEAMAEGTNVVVVPRPEPYPEMEEDRWKMLSDFASGLLADHKVVVYTDVDEILVADPRRGRSIASCLAAATAPASHAVGIEVIHRGDLEAPLDPSRPVLSQRGFFRTNSFHGKPCIITEPVRWGRGGHFHDKPKVRFLPGVICFHLRFYDEDIFLQRSERRRQTTKAPEGLDQSPNRLWRTSDGAAKELLESFRQAPITPFGWLGILSMKLRVWRRAASRPGEDGLYWYPRYASKRLYRLSKRFNGLF